MTAVTRDGLVVPAHDRVVKAYVASGAADNDDLLTETLYRGGVQVGIITYTYQGSTNNCTSITLTSAIW